MCAIFSTVTAAEGAIGGVAGYSTPYLMKYLLYTLQILYLFLFLATDLVPTNKWNSIWIGSVFVFTTTGFWAISERCNLHTENSNHCFVH